MSLQIVAQLNDSSSTGSAATRRSEQNATTTTTTATPTQSSSDFWQFVDVRLALTIVYLAIFVIGVVGNICNCLVIADGRNRYMKTATNYYLFSLSVSDLLLLIFGLPHDIVNLWHPSPYLFGQFVCISRGWISEASTYASVLVIVAFTVERYIAICHPLKAQTLSRLSRCIRIIILIWLLASTCALVVVKQYGVVSFKELRRSSEANGKYVEVSTIQCTMVERNESIFELSVLIFFIIPMAVITILYVRVGYYLRRRTKQGKLLQEERKQRTSAAGAELAANNKLSSAVARRSKKALRRGSSQSKLVPGSPEVSAGLPAAARRTQSCAPEVERPQAPADSKRNSAPREAEGSPGSDWRRCICFWQPPRGSRDEACCEQRRRRRRRRKRWLRLSLAGSPANRRLWRGAEPDEASSARMLAGAGQRQSDTAGSQAAPAGSQQETRLSVDWRPASAEPAGSHQSGGELAGRPSQSPPTWAPLAESLEEPLQQPAPIGGQPSRIFRFDTAASVQEPAIEPAAASHVNLSHGSFEYADSPEELVQPPATPTPAVQGQLPVPAGAPGASAKAAEGPAEEAATSASAWRNKQPGQLRFKRCSDGANCSSQLAAGQSPQRKVPNGTNQPASATTTSFTCRTTTTTTGTPPTSATLASCPASIKQSPIALQSTVNTKNMSNVIKMLVSVVVMFFICWAPFHAQRLMAVYVTEPTLEQEYIYSLLNHISGISYYISAVVNPILYSLFSVRFRQAFRDTFSNTLRLCGRASPSTNRRYTK